MKIYIVAEVDFDYNDEYYYPKGEKSIAAFLHKNNALLKKAQLMDENKWRPQLEYDRNSEVDIDLYKIVELDVDESEIIFKKKD